MFAREIFFCVTVVAMTGCVSIQGGNHIADEVTHSFSAAVEEKNGEKFKSLFLNENIDWFAVVSAQDMAGIYKNDQNQNKVNNHQVIPFAEWLSKTEESTQVKFTNCRTSGDGDVMATACKYAFYLDGKKTNYGRESFILINTGAGWKISSIAFSSTVADKNVP